MTPPRWHRYALLAPFALILLLMLLGGVVNRVSAHGRLVDDTNGEPIPDATVTYGSRATVTDADGRYAMDNLPRGATLLTQHKYYGRNGVSAEATELRLVPLTITYEVHDAATGKGVDTPEARQPADVQVGKGTSSGEMVVAPFPARDVPLLICAANYKSIQVQPKGNLQNVDLTFAEGQSCPPLRTPVPTPTPSITPVPSGSAAPSPGGAPSPTPPPPTASP
jgi:hypothetical protein